MSVLAWKAAAAAMGLAILGACTEPRSPRRASETSPELEARLELSDAHPSVGSEIIVRVRLDGERAKKIATFTGRLGYDTASLRFVAELPSADGATRVTNPASGLIRSAALSTDGFNDQTVVAYRFTVLDPSGVGRVRLTIDELHDQTMTDALASVQVRREPVVRAP
jgi:hypothetical protein